MDHRHIYPIPASHNRVTKPAVGDTATKRSRCVPRSSSGPHPRRPDPRSSCWVCSVIRRVDGMRKRGETSRARRSGSSSKRRTTRTGTGDRIGRSVATSRRRPAPSRHRRHRVPPTSVVLGSDLSMGQRPQVVVPPDAWQAATPLGSEQVGYTLVSGTVAPVPLRGVRARAAGVKPDGLTQRRRGRGTSHRDRRLTTAASGPSGPIVWANGSIQRAGRTRCFVTGQVDGESVASIAADRVERMRWWRCGRARC